METVVAWDETFPYPFRLIPKQEKMLRIPLNCITDIYNDEL